MNLYADLCGVRQYRERKSIHLSIKTAYAMKRSQDHLGDPEISRAVRVVPLIS